MGFLFYFRGFNGTIAVNPHVSNHLSQLVPSHGGLLQGGESIFKAAKVDSILDEYDGLKSLSTWFASEYSEQPKAGSCSPN